MSVVDFPAGDDHYIYLGHEAFEFIKVGIPPEVFNRVYKLTLTEWADSEIEGSETLSGGRCIQHVIDYLRLITDEDFATEEAIMRFQIGAMQSLIVKREFNFWQGMQQITITEVGLAYDDDDDDDEYDDEYDDEHEG